MLEIQENLDASIGYFQNTRILDEATVQTLGTELLEAAARAKGGKMIVNFKNVVLMSSAMIGKLVLLRNRCEEAGIKLAFCEITENVKEVFQLMKLETIVDLYGTEEEAKTALGIE